jgi:hypothetical protein
MHGDLTPWNLREAPGHGLLLYDWERAGWAPQGADEVLYGLAQAGLRGGHHTREARLLCARWPEAAAFWAARLRLRRPVDAGEEALLAAELAILDPGGTPAVDETGLLSATCGPALLDEDAEPVFPIGAGGG